MKLLPDYLPPEAHRAALAAGLAPLLVLGVFVLVVTKLMSPPAAFALLATTTLWLAWEMHTFQRAIDDYNRGYIDAHLTWRSSDTLLALVAAADADPPTREFVQRFVASGRRTLRDGQVHEL